MYPSNPEQLYQTVMDFMEAETWAESKRILEQHPELLDDEADRLLVQLIASQTDRQTIEYIHEYRQLLYRCRLEGIEAAFAPLLQTESPGRPALEIPAEFRAEVQQITELARLAQRDPRFRIQQIALIQGVLSRLPPGRSPAFRGAMLMDLGAIYTLLPAGDPAENLWQAIASYREATHFFTPESYPLYYARVQSNLGGAYARLPTGDRAENLQRAIAAYQEALRFLPPEDNPLDYASILKNIGTAYDDLPTGDRAENLMQVIQAYHEALDFFTPETAPLDYAATQNLLGNAYADLPNGDRAENLQQAIACYQEALRFHTPETAPQDYASTQNNLGNAYTDLPSGDRAENLRQAIAAYREALRFYTPEIDPVSYAITQSNLGLSYYNLPTEDRARNLQQAIACFQEALRFLTAQAAPPDFAATQTNLGRAYAGLPAGDPAENLQKAIIAFQKALHIFTPEFAPQNYAALQVDLGDAYLNLPTGDRAKNVQQAVTCYQEALRFSTPETNPMNFASIQNKLGQAYTEMPSGDRAENLYQAIAVYHEALRYYTPETSPRDYAATQTNLGSAYLNLPTGDQRKNVERAIAAFREALRFLTPKSDPMAYATTQNNLGNAYAILRPRGQVENLEQAISAYQEALRFMTPKTAPLKYASIQTNLGNAYLDLPTENKVENYRRAIDCYQEALRSRTSDAAPLDYAMTQYALGIAYRKLAAEGQPERLNQAIDAYHEALRYFTPETDPYNHIHVAYSLGSLHFNERHWEQAHAAFTSTITALDILYQNAATEVARQAVLAEAANLYPNDAYCLARLGRLTEAVERLEAGKTRALAEALARDRATLAQADPRDRAAFEAARDRIKALEVEARLLGAAGSGSGGAQKFIQITARLRAARQELAEIVQRIQIYLEQFMPTGLDFQSIAAAGTQSNPLVYVITTSQGSLGMIVPPEAAALDAECCAWMDDFCSDDLNGLFIKRVHLPPNTEVEVTGIYSFGQDFGDLAHLQSWLDETLPILRERLAGPLAERLVELGYRRASLILSGSLSLLPLPAAFDTITLAFAPSARALQAARQAALERKGHSPVLLGIGNPQPNPQSLAFARAEVDSIASLFPGEAQRLLYEQQATRADTLENLAGATHLHFSCHGTFNLEEPLDSGLYLSGDDRLMLRDLLDGDLDLSKSRLTVLSACQSGITDVMRVPDEAVGLPAGFLQAGVPGVVSSLWPVDDLSTGLLMDRFYRYHITYCLNPAQALARAQHWLRNATARRLAITFKRLRDDPGASRRMAYEQASAAWRRFAGLSPSEKPFAHPYYWAAFTFTGV